MGVFTSAVRRCVHRLGELGRRHAGLPGRHIRLKVRGLGVGAIGASHFSAEGEVYHLRHAHDIFGAYTALNAQATAGAGGGVIDMQNEHGVEIRAHSTSAGLELSLAPTGMVIQRR